MKRGRVTVTEIRRDESVRGKPGVFGRAEIVEPDGAIAAVTFSRLDGEARWFADSMWVGERASFHHGQGERGVRKYALAGHVERAVEAAAKTLERA